MSEAPSAAPLPEAPPAAPAASDPVALLRARIPAIQKSLPQFQEDLQRALETTVPLQEAWAAVRVGGQGWLLPMQDLAATATAKPKKMGRMPLAPAWIGGITNIRGQVYTVVDMHQVLKGSSMPPETVGWLTALAPHRAEWLALWWPEWVGLRARSSFTPVALEGTNKAWMDAEGEVWFEWNAADWLRRYWKNSPRGSASGLEA